MKYRTLGRTAFSVSEISFGAWAIGGAWGDVSDAESLAALEKAVDCGVNFIDVYFRIGLYKADLPITLGNEGAGTVGFDCSGLTAWSWGQVGVGLPHYSGAQMGDSTPVPISDLQPGDLLFYGPGGSQHVAMYVGPGTMIEAPYTGASVWVTSLRLGGDFVGAGRP